MMDTRLPFVVLLILTSSAPLCGQQVKEEKPKEEKKPAAKQPAAKPAAQAANDALVTISEETTFVTEPVRDDGYIDFLEAFNRHFSQGITTGNNAAVLFWKAFGPPEFDGAALEEFYRRLGIEPLPKTGDYFESLDEFVDGLPPAEQQAFNKQYDPEDEDNAASVAIDLVQEKPWTAEQHPLVARWLERNGKPLDTFVQGTTRPRYYSPFVAGDAAPQMISVLLPDLMHARDLARALRARAMLRLGSGEAEAALGDTFAVHRTGRLLSDSGATVITSLVGIAINDMACHTSHTAAHSGRVSAEQIAAHRKRLAEFGPWSSMAEALNWGERLMFIDAVCMVAREGPEAMGSLTGGDQDWLSTKFAEWITRTSIDWDRVLRMGNKMYDKLVGAARTESLEERRDLIDAYMQQVDEMASRVKDRSYYYKLLLGEKSIRGVITRQVGGIFVALLLPALDAALSRQDEADVIMDLTAVSLALASYHQQEGSYPPSLSTLVEAKLLGKLPEDRFSGKPLIYRPADGGFRLYSAGANGQDDDGRPRWDDEQPGDDILLQVEAGQ